jgi:hypothetical protein
MFTGTFFFLVLALCIFGGLVCFAMARSLRAASVANTVQPSPDEKAAWERLKKALVELHSRYEGLETPKEKLLRSWAGTSLICSGLCMIGILLETRYDTLITVKSVVSGLVGGQKVNMPPPAQPRHHDEHAKSAKGTEHGTSPVQPESSQTAKPTEQPKNVTQPAQHDTKSEQPTQHNANPTPPKENDTPMQSKRS